MLKQVLFGLCLGLAAGTATAQIYTWTDSKGVKHASDQPPPEVDVKTTVKGGNRAAVAAPAPVAGSAPVAPATASGPRTMKEKELDFNQRRAAQTEAAEKAQKEAQAKAERDAYCQTVRNNLSLYETGGRVTKANAKGEKEFLTDAQLAQEAEKARGQLARDCR